MAGKSENTNNTSINEALFQACEAGDSELCQRLLEVGADANHLESGITPLVKAMSAGDCVQVEQPFTLPDGETALEWCMDLAEPWMAVVECLLAAGADVNQILEDEKTSLHVACELCIANAVVRLIAAGVDVNHRSQVGTPLIHHIVLTAQATMYILQTLLDAGADPNACDLRGQSALLCAISHDSRLVLEVLVAAGVDVNQTNKKGRTALHIACEVCSLDVVEFLISAGCDLQKRTDNGETPLQCACFQSDGSLHAYDCLIEAGARFEPKETDTFPWIIICEEQNLELVRRLAQWPAIMELPDENEEGALALHAASSSGSVAIVDFLLESGISVHQPDKSGSNSTPLMHAAHAACIETMQHLLEAGADVNQPNEEGMTPIHFLARHPFWDPEGKALQLLLCAGADINACSKVGMTAIKYAIASSRLPENSEEKPSFIQYVTLLLEHGAEAIAVYGDSDEVWSDQHKTMHRSWMLTHPWSVADVWRHELAVDYLPWDSAGKHTPHFAASNYLLRRRGSTVPSYVSLLIIDVLLMYNEAPLREAVWNNIVKWDYQTTRHALMSANAGVDGPI